MLDIYLVPIDKSINRNLYTPSPLLKNPDSEVNQAGKASQKPTRGYTSVPTPRQTTPVPTGYTTWRKKKQEKRQPPQVEPESGKWTKTLASFPTSTLPHYHRNNRKLLENEPKKWLPQVSLENLLLPTPHPRFVSKKLQVSGELFMTFVVSMQRCVFLPIQYLKKQLYIGIYGWLLLGFLYGFIVGFLSNTFRRKVYPYTAFSTPDGLYEYLQTPMGVSSSPSCFNRMVQHIFQDLHEFAETYFDDIFTFTKSHDINEHLAALDRVLQRCFYMWNWPSACFVLQPFLVWETSSDAMVSTWILLKRHDLWVANRFTTMAMQDRVIHYIGVVL